MNIPHSQTSLSQRILVWDLPTRVFHWALPVLIVTAWGTAENDWMDYHKLAGYGILTLLLFRIVWGFVGSTHSRFSDFIRRPGTTLGYAKAMKAGKPSQYVGHNPLGGWMVAGLLLVLLAQAGSGLFASDDIMTNGPLHHLVADGTASLLTTIHEINFYFLAGLVVVHIGAILAYRLLKGENLVSPMLTGRKAMNGVASSTAQTSPLWLAALILSVASTTVWWISTLG